MHVIHTTILDEFRRNPSVRYTTSDLLRISFPQEYSAIRTLLLSTDRQSQREALLKKAQLHRKLLYHLNKLKEANIITITDVKGRGEKEFGLALDHGELVIEDGGKRVVIAKMPTATTNLDHLERANVLRKYHPTSWLAKYHAVMLNGENFPDISSFSERYRQLLPVIGDVLAINRADQLLSKTTVAELVQLLNNFNLDARELDINISLLINVQRLTDDKLIQALTHTLSELSEKVHFIFTVTPRIVSIKEPMIERLLHLFSQHRKPFSLKNHAIFSPPLFFGNAGTYTMNERDYDIFRKHIRGSTDSCAIGNLSVVLDLQRHFSQGGSIVQLRQLVQRTCHGLFEVDEQRRRLMQPDSQGKAFRKIAQYYIRFKNSHILEERREFTLELLESLRTEVEQFCKNQEVIYKSCGLPIRFNIAFGTTFHNFDPEYYSEYWRLRTTIGRTRDLQYHKMKDYLKLRENLFNIVDGADRLRFFIDTNTSQQEMLRIIRHLLNAHDLPTFTFNFHGKHGNLKLTDFIEGLYG